MEHLILLQILCLLKILHTIRMNLLKKLKIIRVKGKTFSTLILILLVTKKILIFVQWHLDWVKEEVLWEPLLTPIKIIFMVEVIVSLQSIKIKDMRLKVMIS